MAAATSAAKKEQDDSQQAEAQLLAEFAQSQSSQRQGSPCLTDHLPLFNTRKASPEVVISNSPKKLRALQQQLRTPDLSLEESPSPSEPSTVDRSTQTPRSNSIIDTVPRFLSSRHPISHIRLHPVEAESNALLSGPGVPLSRLPNNIVATNADNTAMKLSRKPKPWSEKELSAIRLSLMAYRQSKKLTAEECYRQIQDNSSDAHSLMWNIILQKCPDRSRKAVRKLYRKYNDDLKTRRVKQQTRLPTSETPSNLAEPTPTHYAESMLWTEEEDAALIEAYQTYHNRWGKVAKFVKRSPDACRKRWEGHVSAHMLNNSRPSRNGAMLLETPKKPRMIPWPRSEDKALLAAVREWAGMSSSDDDEIDARFVDWNHVAGMLVDRNQQEVLQRWMHLHGKGDVVSQYLAALDGEEASNSVSETSNLYDDHGEDVEETTRITADFVKQAQRRSQDEKELRPNPSATQPDELLSGAMNQRETRFPHDDDLYDLSDEGNSHRHQRHSPEEQTIRNAGSNHALNASNTASDFGDDGNQLQRICSAEITEGVLRAPSVSSGQMHISARASSARRSSSRSDFAGFLHMLSQTRRAASVVGDAVSDSDEAPLDTHQRLRRLKDAEEEEEIRMPEALSEQKVYAMLCEIEKVDYWKDDEIDWAMIAHNMRNPDAHKLKMTYLEGRLEFSRDYPHLFGRVAPLVKDWKDRLRAAGRGAVYNETIVVKGSEGIKQALANQQEDQRSITKEGVGSTDTALASRPSAAVLQMKPFVTPIEQMLVDGQAQSLPLQEARIHPINGSILQVSTSAARMLSSASVAQNGSKVIELSSGEEDITDGESTHVFKLRRAGKETAVNKEIVKSASQASGPQHDLMEISSGEDTDNSIEIIKVVKRKRSGLNAVGSKVRTKSHRGRNRKHHQPLPQRSRSLSRAKNAVSIKSDFRARPSTVPPRSPLRDMLNETELRSLPASSPDPQSQIHRRKPAPAPRSVMGQFIDSVKERTQTKHDRDSPSLDTENLPLQRSTLEDRKTSKSTSAGFPRVVSETLVYAYPGSLPKKVRQTASPKICSPGDRRLIGSSHVHLTSPSATPSDPKIFSQTNPSPPKYSSTAPARPKTAPGPDLERGNFLNEEHAHIIVNRIATDAYGNQVALSSAEGAASKSLKGESVAMQKLSTSPRSTSNPISPTDLQAEKHAKSQAIISSGPRRRSVSPKRKRPNSVAERHNSARSEKKRKVSSSNDLAANPSTTARHFTPTSLARPGSSSHMSGQHRSRNDHPSASDRSRKWQIVSETLVADGRAPAPHPPHSSNHQQPAASTSRLALQRAIEEREKKLSASPAKTTTEARGQAASRTSRIALQRARDEGRKKLLTSPANATTNDQSHRVASKPRSGAHQPPKGVNQTATTKRSINALTDGRVKNPKPCPDAKAAHNMSSSIPPGKRQKETPIPLPERRHAITKTQTPHSTRATSLSSLRQGSNRVTVPGRPKETPIPLPSRSAAATLKVGASTASPNLLNHKKTPIPLPSKQSTVFRPSTNPSYPSVEWKARWKDSHALIRHDVKLKEHREHPPTSPTRLLPGLDLLKKRSRASNSQGKKSNEKNEISHIGPYETYIPLPSEQRAASVGPSPQFRQAGTSMMRRSGADAMQPATQRTAGVRRETRIPLPWEKQLAEQEQRDAVATSATKPKLSIKASHNMSDRLKQDAERLPGYPLVASRVLYHYRDDDSRHDGDTFEAVDIATRFLDTEDKVTRSADVSTPSKTKTTLKRRHSSILRDPSSPTASQDTPSKKVRFLFSPVD